MRPVRMSARDYFRLKQKEASTGDLIRVLEKIEARLEGIDGRLNSIWRKVLKLLS
jgi:hypothetical protein